MALLKMLNLQDPPAAPASPVMAVVVPVYRNEESIPALLDALADVAGTLRATLGIDLEAMFVIDGSPDHSEAVLASLLPHAPFAAQIVTHSRNFGSFAAIRTGLAHAEADFYGVLAADLQEPPALLANFAAALSTGDHDIAVGVRTGRDDPAASAWAARCFWSLYRRFINPEIPAGGVDVFACSRRVRDALVALGEANTSLIGQLYWLGFRRAEVPYRRQRRQHGRSGWTFARKVRYMLDSVFAFTDLPIRLLAVLGATCVAVSVGWAVAVVLAKLVGGVPVSGYAALAVMTLFFGGINAVGVGIAGAYAWRAYENTKGRPLSLTSNRLVFPAAAATPSRRHAA
jgi:polyisoprenyl-phosphate glycosyltransferase